jgi:hypothetical protein
VCSSDLAGNKKRLQGKGDSQKLKGKRSSTGFCGAYI